MTKNRRERNRSYELLLKREEENIKLSRKHYGKELSIFVECFNLLVDTVHHISNILGKPATYAQACIVANCGRILTSLGAYIDLLMKGYYYDAIVIERSLIENVYLIECFVKDEKSAEKWVKGELTFSKIKKELDLYSDEKFVKYYLSMCDFVHANMRAIFTLLVETHKTTQVADVYIIPRFRLDPNIALMFFPLVGFMTLSDLILAFNGLMNPKMKTQIVNSLKMWNLEVGKLCDRVIKELGKTSAN